jgi:hypothetical protein
MNRLNRCAFVGITLKLSIVLAVSPLRGQVAITEIMYNAGPAGEEGRQREFIEICNITQEPIDLSGWYFSRGVIYEFPSGTWLEGGAYLVVAADPTTIKDAHSIANVVGPWDAATALDNGGETIALAEPSGAEVVKVRYNDRGNWPAAPDGTGHSLAIESPYKEVDDPDSWDASPSAIGAAAAVPGGSPGKVNPATPAKTLLINEGLLWTSGGKWIEIYNPTGDAIDLLDLYITDDPRNLAKVRLASNPVPPGGRFVLAGAPIGLELLPDAPYPGGRVFVALVSADATKVIDAYNFQPVEEERSEARIPDGDEDWAPAATPTPGTANEVPVETDAVIDEILYHPIGDDSTEEFVELYNRSDRTISLEGCRFSQGIDFDFPAGTVMAPGGYLVVARDPGKVQAIHGLPASVVLGPAQDAASLDAFGFLANAGERITLVDAHGNVMDTVRYYDGGDWPKWPDGLGSSLELIDPFADNSVGHAWDASDDSAKAQVSSFSYSGKHLNQGESELALAMMNRGIAIVDDIAIRSDGPVIVEDEVYIPFGAAGWRYVKGTAEASSPIDAWRGIGFDDGSWTEDDIPIGYGDNGALPLATALNDMRNGYLTVFLRKTFTVAGAGSVDRLLLEAYVDDGFAAYLNGTLVASPRVGSTGYNQPATNSSFDPPVLEKWDLDAYKSVLVDGTNVLAVQVHNTSIGSSDVYFDVRLYRGHEESGGEGPSAVPNSTFEANASGWRIEGTHVASGRTTESPISGTGSLKLIASGRGDNKVNRIECDTSPFMNTTDTYTISFNARWVVGSRTIITHGYQNMQTNLAASHQLLIPENLGTPGSTNESALRLIARSGSGNGGPTISRIRHSPSVPQANETVTIEAKITDRDGVASAVVRYYVDTPGAQEGELAMTDPDGDSVYTAVIPGLALGRKVLFWIEATDASGADERFPADVTRRAHPLILDPTSPDPAVQRYLIYRHDTRALDTGNRSLKYRFLMSDLDESYLNTRILLSNDPVEGTFLFRTNDAAYVDDVYYGCALRFTGSPWARARWQSLRIRFPGDRLLHGCRDQFNLEQLGGGLNDGSPGHQRITCRIFRKLSRPGEAVPTPFFRQARIWVNARDLGVHDELTVPGGEMIGKHWPGDEDGDFLEMDDRFALSDAGQRTDSLEGRLRYPPYPEWGGSGDDQEEYRWFFNLRQDEDGDNYGNLIDFCRVMDPTATANAVFDGLLPQYANVGNLVRHWAVRLNSDDWDSWGANRGKNEYFYRPRTDGRWHILPWDHEISYGNANNFTHPTGSTGSFSDAGRGFNHSEVNRLLDRPIYRRLYYGVLKEMVDGPFRSADLAPYMTKLDALGIAGTQAGKSGGYVDTRRARILTWINPVLAPAVPFAITSPNGGNPMVTTSPTVNLGGTAPVNAFTIMVTNEARPDEVLGPAVFSSTSMTGWSLDGIPLEVGPNNLTAIGRDSSGTVILFDTIAVTYKGDWPAPAISSIAPAAARAGEIVAIEGTEFRAGVAVLFGSTPADEVTFDPAYPTSLQAVVPSLAGGVHDVRVRNIDTKESNALAFTFIPPPERFIRGDGNLDGSVDLSDAVKILIHLFDGGSAQCRDALDTDDDGTLILTDAVYLLEFLFLSGPEPKAPFPAKGPDETEDPITCETGLP